MGESPKDFLSDEFVDRLYDLMISTPLKLASAPFRYIRNQILVLLDDEADFTQRKKSAAILTVIGLTAEALLFVVALHFKENAEDVQKDASPQAQLAVPSQARLPENSIVSSVAPASLVSGVVVSLDGEDPAVAAAAIRKALAGQR